MQHCSLRSFFCLTMNRVAGADATGGLGADPLFVPASEDPLACLLELQQQQHDQSLATADLGWNPASLDILDHPLMLTDGVRSLLAVLAPWLVHQQPFLLVSMRQVSLLYKAERHDMLCFLNAVQC